MQQSPGEVETVTSPAELWRIDWPEEEKIDVIDFRTLEKEKDVRLVLNMPLDLAIRVIVALDFSVWDSIDKESVSMGGRSIEVNKDIKVRATLSVDIKDVGTEDQEIVYVDSEIDDPNHEIKLDLGEVDVFEPQDAWDGEGQG